jgi:serine/threonine protein kinase
VPPSFVLALAEEIKIYIYFLQEMLYQEFSHDVIILNRRGIVHRDLKAANLLIDEHAVSFPYLIVSSVFFQLKIATCIISLSLLLEQW